MNVIERSPCVGIRSIVRFFDLWDASREKKEKQMEAFSHAWNKIKNKSKMVDWVKK
ncbi:hypothetical protein [Aeromonas caviae]|uniref:hypothetical protein n=1 Tax=Aeromonas caviae TaxID=648 RepID=UPI0015860469|nr:hypothetical protein [Aeromonas caviae]